MASHRKHREGGGVIIYINEDLTYQPLISISDKMCSMVAIYTSNGDWRRKQSNHKMGSVNENWSVSWAV